MHDNLAFQIEHLQEFGHNVTELTIFKQSVNAYFRCLAINKAGSDSDVKRVLISPTEGNDSLGVKPLSSCTLQNFPPATECSRFGIVMGI